MKQSNIIKETVTSELTYVPIAKTDEEYFIFSFTSSHHKEISGILSKGFDPENTQSFRNHIEHNLALIPKSLMEDNDNDYCDFLNEASSYDYSHLINGYNPEDFLFVCFTYEWYNGTVNGVFNKLTSEKIEPLSKD